jgi:Eukaryotic aspartyl protease
VLATSDTASALKTLSVDGVLGLGLTTSGNPPTYVETLHKQNKIDFPLFALRYESKWVLNIGSYTNDDLDLTNLTTTSVNAPTSASSPWVATASGISISSVSFLGISVTFSISTINITVDSGSYNKISNHYGSLGCSVTPSIVCKNVSDDLIITIEGHNLTVPASVLWISKDNSYYLAINSQSTTTSGWVLGEVFLQNFLTVFDYGSRNITFISFESGSISLSASLLLVVMVLFGF